MKTDALIEGPFRYRLTRAWGEELLRVCWVMLNPSTADASLDDPTIRKCIGFTKRLGVGFSALEVVNLFAFRATDPRQLEYAEGHAPFDVVGPKNDAMILEAVDRASLVICAWGAFETKNYAVRHRARAVSDLLKKSGHPRVTCLGRAKNGQPRHPLMLPYSAGLEVWP